MVLRTLTNVGSPITSGDGTPLQGVVISFRLVNIQGQPQDFFTTAGERVAALPVTATTDTNGEFSIDLPTTDQTPDAVYWLCSIGQTTPGIPAFKDFMSTLNAGPGSATFVDFKRNIT